MRFGPHKNGNAKKSHIGTMAEVNDVVFSLPDLEPVNGELRHNTILLFQAKFSNPLSY